MSSMAVNLFIKIFVKTFLFNLGEKYIQCNMFAFLKSL